MFVKSGGKKPIIITVGGYNAYDFDRIFSIRRTKKRDARCGLTTNNGCTTAGSDLDRVRFCGVFTTVPPY